MGNDARRLARITNPLLNRARKSGKGGGKPTEKKKRDEKKKIRKERTTSNAPTLRRSRLSGLPVKPARNPRTVSRSSGPHHSAQSTSMAQDTFDLPHRCNLAQVLQHLYQLVCHVGSLCPCIRSPPPFPSSGYRHFPRPRALPPTGPRNFLLEISPASFHSHRCVFWVRSWVHDK